MNEAVTTKKEPAEIVVLDKPAAQDNNNEVMEIDLLEVFYLLLSRVHLIVFFLLLGALVLNAYAYFGIHPTYQSTSTLYVVSASGGNVVDLTDFQIGNNLKSDYQELIMSYPVLDRVSSRLNLDWSTAKMASAIRIQNPTDTRILRLTATAESPQLAMDIANTLAEVSVEYLPVAMSTDAPNIAQTGRLPGGKTDPSYVKYTLMGGMIGAALCCAWIVVQYLLDDTVHTAEDMEKYFDAAPLASIPFVEAFEPKQKRRRRGHRKKKKNRDGDAKK